MFQKVNVPLLGVAENMSYFMDPMGNRHTVFGEGGGNKTAESLGTVLLGQVPLLEEIRACGDSGQPIVVSDPTSDITTIFKNIAQSLLRQLVKK
jgi:ATP-binding protein involved in chromosome partitioning